MNIVFMGTPDFAVPCLQALIDSGEKISAVFTQPDKPKGRGYILTPPPVKELAIKYNIPVYQPNSLKKGEDAESSLKILEEIAPDLIIVVAYGKILPKSVLDIPKLHCINVHASLLPKYRGSGPIQWSVLNGEKETGVTTMIMAEGIDTGDMLLKSKTLIGINETASELHDRLSQLGAELLIKTIQGIKENGITPEAQDNDLSNHAPMLTKDLCPIDFSKSAQEVHNHIRGLSEWPCATAFLGDKKIKIYKSSIVPEAGANKIPGEVVSSNDLVVACGDGNGISILELQAEGGKRLKSSDYLRGNRVEVGTILK